MTITLDPRDTSARTHQPGDDLVHIGEADAHNRPLTGYALCGYRLSGTTASPIGSSQLCIVCQHLAHGDWTEPEP